MSAICHLATRWQHSIANSYFKRITYRPSKTHEEFRIVTPTEPESKGILLDQIFTMEWEKLRQAVRVTLFAQPVEQIDEPTWTAWTLQRGGGGGVNPNPKQKRMWLHDAEWKQWSISLLQTSFRYRVVWRWSWRLCESVKIGLAERLQNVRYVTWFYPKVQLVVIKSLSGLLVDKVDLINKRETAQICQCCSRDPGKHNWKILSACWIM